MNLISLLLYKKDKINFEISERVEKVNIKERELCQKLTLVRLQIWDFSQCWVKLESPDAICWLSLLCLIQSWFSECLRITDRLPPPDFVIIFLLLFVQASVSLYTWALGQKKNEKKSWFAFDHIIFKARNPVSLSGAVGPTYPGLQTGDRILSEPWLERNFSCYFLGFWLECDPSEGLWLVKLWHSQDLYHRIKTSTSASAAHRNEQDSAFDGCCNL